VLLDTDKRREYDASLAAEPAVLDQWLEPPAPPVASMPRSALPAAATAKTTSYLASSPPSQGSGPIIRQRLLHWFAVGSLTIGVAAVVAVAIALASRKPPPAATAQSATSTPIPQAPPIIGPQPLQQTPITAPRPPAGTAAVSPPPVSMDVADAAASALRPSSASVPLSRNPLHPPAPRGKRIEVKRLGKTDLLNAVPRTIVAGDFAPKSGLKGIVSAGNAADRVEFQIRPPAEYMLQATFIRLKGSDAIFLGIVVDDHPAAIVIDKYSNTNIGEGHFSGLDCVNSLSLYEPKHPAAAKGPLLANGNKHTLRVVVKRNSVTADLDGRRLVQWSGKPSALGISGEFDTPNSRHLSLGTLNNSMYYIQSLELSEIEVAGATPSEAPLTTAPVAPASSAATVEAAKSTRLPLPSEAALAAARAKMKETFGEAAAKSKKPQEKQQLLAELREAAESEKDPAIRYALLDAARRQAMGAQDVPAALLVALEIARQYETDPLDQQLQTLKLTAGTTMPASAWEAAAGAAQALAETGRDTGRIDVADGASLLAVDFAAKGKDWEQRRQARQLRDLVLAHKKSAVMVQEAEETLRAKPDDPAANLIVGKWRCFVLDDWAKGLPCLEKCSVPSLVAVANAEKQSQNPLAIADAWYAAVEELKGAERIAARRRSEQAYARAAQELTGLDQLRAGKRAAELRDGGIDGKTERRTPVKRRPLGPTTIDDA
jgi:hypothetical protein